jgi:hypothetical protein
VPGCQPGERQAQAGSCPLNMCGEKATTRLDLPVGAARPPAPPRLPHLNNFEANKGARPEVQRLDGAAEGGLPQQVHNLRGNARGGAVSARCGALGLGAAASAISKASRPAWWWARPHCPSAPPPPPPPPPPRAPPPPPGGGAARPPHPSRGGGRGGGGGGGGGGARLVGGGMGGRRGWVAVRVHARAHALTRPKLSARSR